MWLSKCSVVLFWFLPLSTTCSIRIRRITRGNGPTGMNGIRKNRATVPVAVYCSTERVPNPGSLCLDREVFPRIHLVGSGYLPDSGWRVSCRSTTVCGMESTRGIYYREPDRKYMDQTKHGFWSHPRYSCRGKFCFSAYRHGPHDTAASKSWILLRRQNEISRESCGGWNRSSLFRYR